MTVDVQQGSEEWLNLRAGKITASKIKSVVAGDSTTSYKGLISDLVAERMSGKPVIGFKNGYMERGNELEDQAVEAYEIENLVSVSRVGFIIHPEFEYAGCSPDGLVEPDGMVQIKCHKTHIHLNYILGGTVPKEYVRQVQWEMEVSGRSWSDFVSYCPEFPEPHNLWVKRIERDEDMIRQISKEVIKANRQVESIIKQLNEQ